MRMEQTRDLGEACPPDEGGLWADVQCELDCVAALQADMGGSAALRAVGRSIAAAEERARVREGAPHDELHRLYKEEGRLVADEARNSEKQGARARLRLAQLARAQQARRRVAPRWDPDFDPVSSEWVEVAVDEALRKALDVEVGRITAEVDGVARRVREGADEGRLMQKGGEGARDDAAGDAGAEGAAGAGDLAGATTGSDATETGSGAGVEDAESSLKTKGDGEVGAKTEAQESEDANKGTDEAANEDTDEADARLFDQACELAFERLCAERAGRRLGLLQGEGAEVAQAQAAARAAAQAAKLAGLGLAGRAGDESVAQGVRDLLRGDAGRLGVR